VPCALSGVAVEVFVPISSARRIQVPFAITIEAIAGVKVAKCPKHETVRIMGHFNNLSHYIY